jgi:acyl-CoA thioesterase I
MNVRSLYILVLLSVLVTLAGCQTEDPPTETATAPPAAQSPDRPEQQRVDERPAVVVLGNSIAAGYGLEPEEAFPALLQDRIDSLGWDFEVVNAGLSGDTSAGGLRRIDWLLQRNVAVLVLELGGNDGLRGIPTQVTRDNLQGIIDRTRELRPDARIILAGMQIPPNMGAEYANRFAEIYPRLAEANDVALIPFVLEGVGGVRSLNLPDGIHPTARGQEIVADNVWDVLRPILEDIRQED